MFKLDKAQDGAISNTQIIMGEGLWSPENLQKLVSQTDARRNLQPETLQNLLAKPESSIAVSLSQEVAEDLIPASQAIQNQKDMQPERVNAAENEMQQQPQINPLQGAMG